MRSILSISLLSLTLSCAALMPTQASAATGNAIEISIGGIGPGVDARAYKKVKLLISEAVYSDTVAYFDVYGYGKEGGFSACVEKGRFAADGSFERLLKSLKAIRPDARTTAYNVAVADQCTYRSAPLVP